MSSPLYAANNMILRARGQEVNLTNLKLQKLLYILHARYRYDVKNLLFSDRFVAWQYGPVLTEIYEIFKNEGANPISDLRPDANGKVLIISEKSNFGPSFDYVWGNYAHRNAAELVDITHGKNLDSYVTAWRKAINAKGIGAFLQDEDIVKDGEYWFGS